MTSWTAHSLASTVPVLSMSVSFQYGEPSALVWGERSWRRNTSSNVSPGLMVLDQNCFAILLSICHRSCQDRGGGPIDRPAPVVCEGIADASTEAQRDVDQREDKAVVHDCSNASKSSSIRDG